MSPTKYDLAAFIKEHPGHLRIIGIRSVSIGEMALRIVAYTTDVLGSSKVRLSYLHCFNAIDYSIRPDHPAKLEGGPLMEIHDSHPLLESRHLKLIPGGDGAVFDPPLAPKLLILEQSYVIAERFEIAEYFPRRVS